MRKTGMFRTTMAMWLALVLNAGANAQPVDPNWSESGVASWYGPGFAGNPTASGEIYNPDHLTAAHRTLPLGTLVRVYNVENDREMIVRINDRGPFIRGRIIDLSRASAEVLGFQDHGLAQVELTVVQPSATRTAGEAFMDAVKRAADASLDAVLPPEMRPEPGESHVSEAELDSPALPSAPTMSEHRHIRDVVEGFFIQVGAFRESTNAHDLIRRIERLGMLPQLRETGSLVRVLVGPFHERTAAIRAQRDLERAGIDGFLRTSGR